MVLFCRSIDMDETMPQTVPSAGFTPPCDYSNFAENFDLSLLPGGDQPLSPSTLFYTIAFPNTEKLTQPKIYTTFYPDSPQQQNSSGAAIDNDIELGPDFQKLLGGDNCRSSTTSNIYLDVTSCSNYPNSLSPYSPQSQKSLLSPNDQFTNYRQSGESSFYPSSPEYSLYTPSPNSVYSRSPGEDFLQTHFIKKENTSHYSSTSPLPSFSPFEIKEELSPHTPCGFTSSPTSPVSNYSSCTSKDSTADVLLLDGTVLDKQIKQESTVDFGAILNSFQDTTNNTLRQLLEQDLNNKKKASESQIVPEQKPKDHQLLREVLRDTSFQKKYNIKPIDFTFISSDIKMEEPDDNEQSELIRSCEEQIARENIEPVLNLAIEQMRKDVDNTCTMLGISPDPVKWTPADVLSWIRWTCRQFSLPDPVVDQWNLAGSDLIALSEEDFARKAPQCGMILHAQLEIWKAAYSEEGMNWLPETTSSNASSGDVSDDEDDEVQSPTPDPAKPTTSTRSGSHIHLWQFLKELLSTPQQHGSCIRWLDRTQGIFKIEDSVKVARLWGKRKNRPAMNYDKLSRSIRQYYKKGIMKKTERSQRLVYQFCHPYSL